MRTWRVHSATGSTSPPLPAVDAELVAAARINSRAFAPLYERYCDDLLRYCFYCLGDWNDAADATQQIFADAMTGLSHFTDRGDSFRPWLFRIAHNEVCTRQQQHSRRPQRPLLDAALVVDHAPSPEDLAIAADEHERVRQLLTHLAPDRRRICELRFAGLRDREIAAILHKSEGAVRTAQFRAIAQLRQLLGTSLAGTGNADG
jgi:RNA polymerase sigma-70 factor, ECF subfamily